MKNHYRKAAYLYSAHNLRQLQDDDGREVAFAGRSNAGKSSAINVITGNNSLARTSKTPGRTQQIIFFDLGQGRRLVDLPGYGYARVSRSMRGHWHQTLPRFLSGRRQLQGLIVLMDSRHPAKTQDNQLVEWCVELGLPVHILLTKSDKLSRGAGLKALHEIRAGLPGEVTLQLFSAHARQGLDEVRGKLDEWFAWGQTLAGE